jgi:hypothetical protein
VDYSKVVTRDVLKQAGLAIQDVELSLRLAHALNDAVKMRRAKLQEDRSPSESEGQREKRDKTDDDRIFLGAVTLLAQRMKAKPKALKVDRE